MKPFSYISFVCIAVSLLLGCLKDISSEIPENKPKLTVNCFFNPNIPVIGTLSKSKGVLESGLDTPLPDAIGYLYEDGTLVDSILWDDLSTYHVSKQFYSLQSGKKYEIRVAYPGLDSISAGTFLPYPVPIQSVQLDTTFYAPAGHKTYLLRIRFQDLGVENNMYHLMVYRNRLHENGEWATESLCFVSEDPIFEAMGKSYCVGGMFTDASFNGQEKEIVINTTRRLNSKLNDSVQFLVELRNGSPDYYAYNKSLTLFKNGQGDIFVQPSPIIGNVKNGYGIFAGYASDLDTVKLN